MRGTVLLPHGTGRTVRVIAFAKGDKAKEAEAAGADIVGEQDLIDKVKAGFTDFDVAVATPDMMAASVKNSAACSRRRCRTRSRAPSRRTSAPRFATSRPVRSSTASTRPAIVHTIVGKASFDEKALVENVATLLDAIVRAKPSAAKGTYLRSITLASTMGPGVKVDPNRIKPTAATS